MSNTNIQGLKILNRFKDDAFLVISQNGKSYRFPVNKLLEALGTNLGDYIPLAGTENGAPVTGNIIMSDGTSISNENSGGLSFDESTPSITLSTGDQSIIFNKTTDIIDITTLGNSKIQIDGSNQYIEIGNGGTTIWYIDGINSGMSCPGGNILFDCTSFIASPVDKFIINNLPTYADNAAALAALRPLGSLYKTATGQLMIVY